MIVESEIEQKIVINCIAIENCGCRHVSLEARSFSRMAAALTVTICYYYYYYY